MRLPDAVRSVAALVLLALVGLPARRSEAAFDFATVVEKAQKAAAGTWREPTGQVPDWLLKINYHQWRAIRFRPDHALFRDKKSPFQVQFFHPGLYYNRTVRISIVDGSHVQPVAFSPSFFDYGKNDFASRVPQDLGFAGFRIHSPIK